MMPGEDDMDMDYKIQALVDGELAPDQEKAVRRRIRREKALKHRYEELLEQKELLQKWWKNLN